MYLRDELETRLLPLQAIEGAYARNRLQADQAGWPQIGWEVFYRRDEWTADDELYRMRVVDVQSPDDQTSEWALNLWETVRDEHGNPVHIGDRLAIRLVDDPWPWVVLRWEGEVPKGMEHVWKTRPQMTFESRVRGGPGWLPLDYPARRQIRLAPEIVAMREAGIWPERRIDAVGTH